MLDKKDYRAIAEIVALCRVSDITLETPNHQEFAQGINAGCQDIAHRLVEYFNSDDLHFDQQKFLDACFQD